MNGYGRWRGHRVCPYFLSTSVERSILSRFAAGSGSAEVEIAYHLKLEFRVV